MKVELIVLKSPNFYTKGYELDIILAIVLVGGTLLYVWWAYGQ